MILIKSFIDFKTFSIKIVTHLQFELIKIIPLYAKLMVRADMLFCRIQKMCYFTRTLTAYITALYYHSHAKKNPHICDTVINYYYANFSGQWIKYSGKHVINHWMQFQAPNCISYGKNISTQKYIYYDDDEPTTPQTARRYAQNEF